MVLLWWRMRLLGPSHVRYAAVNKCGRRACFQLLDYDLRIHEEVIRETVVLIVNERHHVLDVIAFLREVTWLKNERVNTRSCRGVSLSASGATRTGKGCGQM